LWSGLAEQPGRRRHAGRLDDERRCAGRRRGAKPAVYIRSLYDRQEVRFAGPYGENGFLEDYSAWVQGEPIGNVVLISRNTARQTQHIVGNYRPRSTLLLLSRLVGEHFAGTPHGQHFATDES